MSISLHNIHCYAHSRLSDWQLQRVAIGGELAGAFVLVAVFLGLVNPFQQSSQSVTSRAQQRDGASDALYSGVNVAVQHGR